MCNFIKKRLQHRLLPVTFAKFLRAPCLTEHLQWLLLKVSGFEPATLLKKRLRKRYFSVNFAKFLRTYFLLTGHLRMTAFCVCFFAFLCLSFEEFFRTLQCSELLLQSTSGKLLFYVQVAEFQPPDTVTNYFTGAFQAFYTRSRDSQSKVFIYLKSLKTVCEEVNLL